MKKKVLVAPALSLSLGNKVPFILEMCHVSQTSSPSGRSESAVSDDFPSAFLSPSPDDDEDIALDFDLDAMETPSDTESLPFPIYDLEGQRAEVKQEVSVCDQRFIASDCFPDDLQRLGMASHHRRVLASSPGSRSASQPAQETDQGEPGALDREDVVDSDGTRWRCFSTGVPLQESRVNMTVLQPFLRVLSHAGTAGFLSHPLL